MRAGVTLLPRHVVRLRWLLADQAEAARIDAWHGLLDATEQASAARFRAEADRRAYIAAHALLRQMLAEAGGLPAAAWRFTRGAQGKPEIAAEHEMPWLRFSLSHTRGLAACALAGTDDIGLDVEDLDRRAASPDLARRYFAPEEAAWLDAVPAEDRHAAFLRLWTLKEAYVKATGEGIAVGLDSFAMEIDPPRLLRAPGGTQHWRFLQHQPTPRHILSVALRDAGDTNDPIG